MKKLLAALAAFGMMMGAAHADDHPGQEVNLTLGTSLCQDSGDAKCDDIGPNIAITAGYAYKFTGMLGAGLDIDYSKFGGDLGENLSHLGAYAMFHYYQSAGPVNLDVGLGLGYSSYASEVQSIEATHTSLMGIKAGLAVNYPLNDKMSVGLDVNYIIHGKAKPEVDGTESPIETDAHNQLKVGLGFNYAL